MTSLLKKLNAQQRKNTAQQELLKRRTKIREQNLTPTYKEILNKAKHKHKYLRTRLEEIERNKRLNININSGLSKK